jgi:hypothetical protein
MSTAAMKAGVCLGIVAAPNSYKKRIVVAVRPYRSEAWIFCLVKAPEHDLDPIGSITLQLAL